MFLYKKSIDLIILSKNTSLNDTKIQHQQI